MNRALLFSISTFLLLVGVAMMGGSETAVAGHGCHGCYGCYSSCSCSGYCGGYCSGSCYCSCYSNSYCSGWGRHHFRHGYRRAYRHGYRRAYRHGGWGRGYGCHGCHVSCHGCYGCSAYYGCSCSCSCSCSGNYVEEYSEEVPAEEAAPVEEGASASINVNVPAEAKIYINDRETTTAGLDRRYVSRDLQRGVRYTYEVRAELDGQTQTRVVSLQAGRNAHVAFDFAQATPARTLASAEMVQTRLTVSVPADAKVTLAGNATRSEGAVRNFTTSRLAEGQAWKNYTIVATIVRDGETLTKQQTIELLGGEDREISFDFGAERVAQLK